jgi:hypothetical protein
MRSKSIQGLFVFMCRRSFMTQVDFHPLSFFAALAIGCNLVTPAAAQSAAGTGKTESPARTSSIYRWDTGIDDSGKYRQEVQACRAGLTQQTEETCLEEARNADAARRKGRLDQQGEDFTANALVRCAPFSGENRIACEARVMGYGSTSGSVAGGGLLRPVETVVVPPGPGPVRIEAQTAKPLLLMPLPPR